MLDLRHGHQRQRLQETKLSPQQNRQGPRPFSLTSLAVVHDAQTAGCVKPQGFIQCLQEHDSEGLDPALLPLLADCLSPDLHDICTTSNGYFWPSSHVHPAWKGPCAHGKLLSKWVVPPREPSHCLEMILMQAMPWPSASSNKSLLEAAHHG